MKNFRRTLTAVAFLTLFVADFASLDICFAEDRYVSIAGDDSNPGTQELPWRTLRSACVRLEPGDRLLIGPGDYVEFEDDGESTFEDIIFVRTVGTEEENFAYKPFIGDPEKITWIKALNPHGRPRVFGNFDIRGSYIRIQGLEIIGDPERSIDPGIGVYSSHDIACVGNVVHNHGGGGISFNQSDMVSARGNVCFDNASTNPNQSSGITSFQPILRSPSNRKIGVRFDWNICFKNRNEVLGDSGITDGNGISLDDHYYTQTNNLITSAIAGVADPDGAGVPEISTREELDEDDSENESIQIPLPYARKSVVRNNLCFDNGGRGVHLFFADKAVVTGNFLVANLRSPELTDDLPADEDGNPFFFNGELSSVDSTNAVFRTNIAIAFGPRSVAANEFYFSLEPVRKRGNFWKGNSYFNFGLGGLVSISGLDESKSSLVKDVRLSWVRLLRGFRF
jgi:hypothetical protein